MTVESTIKLLMRARGINYQTFGKMLGIGLTGVSRRLNNGNMTIKNIVEMLDILGYEVIIRESHSGRRREDEIIVTLEDEVEI